MLVMESTPLLLSPMMAGEEVRAQLMLRLEQSQRRWILPENDTSPKDGEINQVGEYDDGWLSNYSVPRLPSVLDDVNIDSLSDIDGENRDGRLSQAVPASASDVAGVLLDEAELMEEEEDDDDDANHVADDDGDDGSHNVTWASYPRRKRSVMGLYHMLQCTSTCNPLGYKGYGCYCGFLGSGTAVDGIDTCCLEHDQCYEEASTCEKKFSYYTVPYKWKCNGYPVCLPGRTARSAKGSCSHRLCECDRQFAECIAEYPCPSNRAICISSAWRRWHNFAFGRNIRQFFRH